MTGETAIFTVEIVLSTDGGELPTDTVVERMVYDQMAGDLGDGLEAIAVKVVGRAGNDSRSETLKHAADRLFATHGTPGMVKAVRELRLWAEDNLDVNLSLKQSHDQLRAARDRANAWSVLGL